MRSMRRTFVLATVVAVLGAGPVSADRYIVGLGSAEINTVADTTAGVGDYFVLQFQPPTGVTAKSLRHAMLEVFVDASARNIGGYTEGTPLVEVYALKGAMVGALNPNLFRAQTVPSVRNVATGSARRVVIDITEIVRGFLSTPASNNGIVMGSLTGSRTGVFALRDDKLGGSTKARITIFD